MDDEAEPWDNGYGPIEPVLSKISIDHAGA